MKKPCRIGVPCKEHDYQRHGAEAEELRKGMEQLICRGTVSRKSIRRLLDSIDARDSLAFLETNRCADAIRALQPPGGKAK